MLLYALQHINILKPLILKILFFCVTPPPSLHSQPSRESCLLPGVPLTLASYHLAVTGLFP